jgi:hypothetical protein
MKPLRFLIVFFYISCTNGEAPIQRIKSNSFIEEPGKYLLGSKQLWLKEFTDGTLVFQVGDDLNRRVLYQQSMAKAFSKHHTWLMYVDDKENIWCYNGDLAEHTLLLWSDKSLSYSEKDYIKDNLAPPKAFRDKLAQ